MFLKSNAVLIAALIAFTATPGCKSTTKNEASVVSALGAGGIEYYDNRPDIKTMNAYNHNIGGSWSAYRRGQLETLAMLYGMYAETTIYFLARDSEHLYDLSRMFPPPGGTQVKLMNVSRLNLKSQNLSQFLAQEGISDQALQNKKNPVVLFDTGFAGSIPNGIKARLSPQVRSKVQAHLIVSNNNNYPSSRVFLSHLPGFNATASPTNMHNKIVEYEHISRWTYRSFDYQYANGKWRPITKLDTYDGNVSKNDAEKYMENIKYYAGTNEAKTLFSKRLNVWQQIGKHVRNGDQAGLTKYLQGLINGAGGELAQIQAIVHDVAEMTKGNFSKFGISGNTLLQNVKMNPTNGPVIKQNTTTFAAKGAAKVEYEVKEAANKKLKKGDIIKHSKEYRVVSLVKDSKSYRLYKVELPDGQIGIMKIAKTADAALKLKEERVSIAKADKVKGVQVSPVLGQGSTMLVKEYIKGVNGYDWVQKWASGKFPAGTPEVVELVKFFKRTARAGVYIQNIRPEDLIWNGKRWVLVNLSGIDTGLAKADIYDKYSEKIYKRWGSAIKEVSNKVKAACDVLVGQF